tara:strand:- start:9193 stop:10119 length:927 start_codon:yes stop_codon:yes gene_type:complete
MSKPKIALCLSGEMREWEVCHERLFDYLQNYDCDVFINTWDELGGSRKKYAKQKVDVDKIEKAYNPIALNVEEKSRWNALERNLDYADKSDPGAIPQYCGWYKTSLLLQRHIKETGAQYEFVVRTRPDFYILQPPAPLSLDEEFLKQLNNTIMCSPGTTIISPSIFVKDYWRRDNHRNLKPFFDNELGSLLKRIDSFDFPKDFYTNFMLEPFKSEISKIDVESLLSPSSISTNPKIYGISDTFSITTTEKYLLYSAMMFYMFVIHKSGCYDLSWVNDTINPLTFCCALYNLKTHVINNLHNTIPSNNT